MSRLGGADLLLYRPYPHRYRQGVSHLPSASHLRRQGLGPRFDLLLQAVQVDQALPAARHPDRGCKY